MMFLKNVLALCVSVAFLFMFMIVPAGAIDLFQKAKEAISIVDTAKGGGGGISGGIISAAGGTFRNDDRKFSFTLPPGWEKTAGDPNSDNVTFRRGNTSQHFTFHYTAMSPSFPAGSSVQASLKSAKEDVKLGKNLSAKRRDDICGPKDKKVTCARGWELIDSGKGGYQRIIYQCYDRNNFYFNFIASSETGEFAGAQDMLQGIIDSIKFEK